MTSVAVVGSTGSVGQAVVHSLASNPAIASVTAITRRAFFSNPPAKIHEHPLEDLKAIQPSDFQSASIVYCCLGTTRGKAGGAQQFREQDHDLIVTVAQKAKEAGVRSFQLVSSAGADANSMALYTQSKGLTEKDVTSVGFPQLGIWRPSILDTTSYPRPERRLLEGVGLSVMSALSGVLGKYRPIKVEDVADAMIKDSLSQRTGVALYDGTTAIVDFLRAAPPAATATGSAESSAK